MKLTPFRKTRRRVFRRPQRGPAFHRPAESLDAIGCLDRLARHCDQTAAVAELMEFCGEDLSPGAISILGGWIRDTAREINTLAQAVREAGR